MHLRQLPQLLMGFANVIIDFMNCGSFHSLRKNAVKPGINAVYEYQLPHQGTEGDIK